ncbi:ribosomal protein L11 methylase [Desulfocurvibacter africanus PCS]|uniref:Ribosomal protein L11 methyltransferase n=1 Tax=Desulfocurvibacter africanus PCS TaxID=1262666 RepID=M5PRP4_DESAF|nr:50S ribosomal protein L11 methyltransferase [Desulfocurvibacter africanus]EMG36745.1 ribosomal protein L11 methylase [Desulfocurvibacter africanus PCS]
MRTLPGLSFSLPASEYEAACAFLAQATPQGWEEDEIDGNVRFRVFFEEPALAMAAAEQVVLQWPEARIESLEVEERDWSEAWRQYFTPVDAGRFLVLPPWMRDKAPEGRTPIYIEPKMAFGTGHHATTALCLEAISELADAGHIRADQRFLDLGTGSGILGIALCTLGLTGLGVDIDPQAITCAQENVSLNDCDKLELSVGTVDAARGPFQVVVANILSGPLERMASDLAGLLAPGGRLILSGILDTQAEAVRRAYTAQGLPEPELRSRGEWVCLRFAKPAN